MQPFPFQPFPFQPFPLQPFPLQLFFVDSFPYFHHRRDVEVGEVQAQV
jgi:hypothetical protein